MLFEIILAIILGILFGTFTGLTPGIHINLISVILLSFSATLLTFTNSLTLATFIVSMAITHTFLDFIPSIFLGAPDEDSFLSILPGHRLLLKGQGYFAAVYTLYGGIAALFIIFLLTPLFIFALPIIYPFLQKIMGIILILISCILILTEKNKILALLIFLLSGFLGIATLNLGIREPLLPLLTGLFGASSLLISIKQKTKIPKQKILPLKEIKLSKKFIEKTSIASIIASPFTAFLPGLGASQAAIIGKVSMNIEDEREFLFLVGAINTIVMGLSFVTLYSIEKTRTGAAVAVSQLLPEITLNNIIFLLFVVLISGILSFFLAINISKLFSKKIDKINYSKLSYIILIFLFFMIIIFSDLSFKGGVLGLLIFITSTALGIFTISKKITRMHLMGCLLLPTIIYYLF